MNPALPRVYDVDLCLRVAALRPGNCRAVPEHFTLYRRHSGQLSGNWRALQAKWRDLLTLVTGYAPGLGRQPIAIGDTNMQRYLAWIACDAGDGRSALGLALSAFRRAPAYALKDRRNWMMLAAASGRLVMPSGLYQRAMEIGKKLLR